MISTLTFLQLATAAALTASPPAADSVKGRDTTSPPTPTTIMRPSPSSSPHQRPKAIEYSDWYARRLTIHRWASYTTLPLFALQYYSGEKLLKEGRYSSPARYIHPPVATALAGLFGLNTLTGVWNLAESSQDPNGRTRRTIHSVLMLLADGGFVVAGTLAEPGLNSSVKRRQHQQVALASMGVSLISYAIMLPPFRRE